MLEILWRYSTCILTLLMYTCVALTSQGLS
jgi:hypothetical protein